MGILHRVFRNWLNEDKTEYGAVVTAEAGLDTDIFRNRMWYRGRPTELMQLYAQSDDMAGNSSFWAASAAAKVRKLHSGLPALMVDVLSDIAVDSFLQFNADKWALNMWGDIERENDFKQLLKRAVRSALALGDGAFKISFDPQISELPIIEFYEADRVSLNYRRGRLNEVVFLTPYEKNNRRYILEEVYSRGGVKYRLLENGREVELNMLEETSGLSDICFAEPGEGFLMAVPLMFDHSSRHEGRGKSIYEGKLGVFDGLDEILSQWIDALRDGRVVKYIPSNFLPRNPHTGEILPPNGFESRYVETDADLSEGSGSFVQVVQPEIKTEAFINSYSTFIDLALQGVIAPATLGIDLKKRDNAEAQREKEKITIYTRNRIIGVLQEVLPKLVRATVWTSQLIEFEEPVDFEVKAEFGEFAAPTFDAQLEAVGKAKGLGIISIETAVDELYGNTWSEEQKAGEVLRIKTEMQGV